MKKGYLIGFCFLISGMIVSCKKESTPTPVNNNGVYFSSVKRIVQQKCISCHSSTGAWQGRPFRLDNDSDIEVGFASIKASVADPATVRNKRMPQGASLTQSQIDTIVAWYNKGGKIKD